MAVWIWDPEFDDYQDLPIYSSDLGRASIEHPVLESIEVQDLVMIHVSALTECSVLDFPVSLISQLEGMSALSLLKQAHDLMSGKGVPDLVRRIGPGIKRIKAWQIPPKHFSVWLGILSADWERVKNPKSDYGCLIVNIGGDCSWKITDGQIMLLPYEYKVVDDVGLGRRSKKINARIVTCGNDAPIIEVSQSWAASKYERL